MARKPSSQKEDSEDERKDSPVEKGPDGRNGSESNNTADNIADSPPTAEEAPPLPDENPPPLPDEAPPVEPTQDDGWAPMWDDRAQAYYFYNRFTNAVQWENPRVPDAQSASHNQEDTTQAIGGYNPAIHGDYDPNADYAKVTHSQSTQDAQAATATNPAEMYGATGAFNRFTGKWQNADFTTERFSDESKSKRQMNAFFDVDAAANSHDGRSLKAERANKKISKSELQAFKNKRREKKEEKRRAWLLD